MSRVLPAYFRRRVGVQIVAVLFILTALMQLLEMLDMTTDVLKRGLGVRGLFYYAWLRLPGELVLALPIAVLLGTMTALHAMARTLEITALRAAGVSLARILVALLPVLALLALFQFAMTERVLPQSANTFKEWWSASAPPDDTPARLWAHTSSGAVAIDSASPDARRLRGVRIYARDKSGLIEARVAAADARWDGKAWQLDDVSDLRIENGRVRIAHVDAREWQTNLGPDEVLRLGVARPNLSSMMLADVLAGTRVGTQPLSYYRTLLYRSFTAPLGVFVMLLLALPMACWQPRASGGGGEMLLALLLGLGFLLCDGILAAFATSGRLSPLVAALAAPIAFAAVGIWRLRAAQRV